MKSLPLALLAGSILCGLAGAQFQILSPSADGVANSRRPTVRWQTVTGADSYRVQVFDATLTTLVDEQTVGAVDETTVGVDLADGGVYNVRYDALRQGRVIGFSFTSRFKVRVVPSWFPDFEMGQHDTVASQGGYRLINLLNVRPRAGTPNIPAIAMINEHGEVVWWYRRHHAGTIEAPKVLENGNVLLTVQWLDQTPVQGRAIEIAWDGEEVWRSAPGKEVHHDVEVGPDGHYLGLHWLWETYQGFVFEGDGVALFDRDDGSVLWEWSIFDHFDPITTPTAEQGLTGLSGLGGDWSHSNAAHWDPARSMIWLSVRHFDSLVGIDYPSGSIRVVLGKLGIGGAGLMSHQHAPEVQSDGAILLYDNGNTYTPPSTRVSQILFDERRQTAMIIDSWGDTPAFFDFAVGDADRLPNENLLVTAGVSGRVIELQRRFSWTPVWEWRIHSTRWWVYRSEWVAEKLIGAHVRPFGEDLWWRHFRGL